MKKLTRFQSHLEAQMAAQFLQAQGISAQVIGHKEYASHLTGKDQGTYDLLVEGEQWAQAEEALRHNLHQTAESIEIRPGAYLRKAVILSAGAAILMPILF